MTENIIKIFVTTDNHLGFAERDPIRGDDSYVTFEECLQIANEAKVDFVLLGGDFFHEHKPSLKCLSRTTGLLRKYVMGNRDVEFDVVSDGRVNFPTQPIPHANFKDPNYNVALPIFTIHGNHDDAVGGVSPIDVLAAAGLVNYFGHSDDVDLIEIHPVLVVKGSTKVALYGLGHVRDERLHRCFKLGKVSLRRPAEDPEGWFRILVVHQNRGIRNPTGKAGLYDDMLAGMADLVIWGNEHEQRILPQEVAVTRGMDVRGFDIMQPGSTVHTSICSEECSQKMCGIVEVQGRSMRFTPHVLRSVRPILHRTVELRKERALEKKAEEVEAYLKNIVEGMAHECKEMLRSIPDSILATHPKLRNPLLRLNVDYNDAPGGSAYPIINPARFGQHFVNITANPSDIIRNLKIRTVVAATADGGIDPLDAEETKITTNAKTCIQDLLHTSTRDVCSMLSENVLGTAVVNFAEKGEKTAIDDSISKLLEDCQKSLWKKVKDEVGPGRILDMDPSTVITRARELKMTVNRDHRPGEIDIDRVADEQGVRLPSPSALPLPLGETAAAAPDDGEVLQGDNQPVPPNGAKGKAAPKPKPKKRDRDASPKAPPKPPPPPPPTSASKKAPQEVVLKWKSER